MNKKQAQSLLETLDYFLSSTFGGQDTVDVRPLYSLIRDSLREDGIEGLQTMLDRRIGEERHFGATKTDMMDIYDILFGETGKVPPLMDKFPGLCKWRFLEGCHSTDTEKATGAYADGPVDSEVDSFSS